MKNQLLIAGLSLLSFFIPAKSFAQVPVASFNLSQATVCVGVPIEITDQSTDSPTAWSYTVDGTTVMTVQNPTVTYVAAGTYTILLVASNANGDSPVFNQTIVVNPLPVVTAASSDPAVCEGSSVTLTGGGASTYNWSDGVTDGASFAPVNTLTYTVTGTDNNGCENTAVVGVTVNPLPSLSVSGGTAVCLGSSISMTVTGADTYVWNGSNAGDVFADSPIVNTSYTVTGTDALTGCSNETVNAIVVNSLPVVSVNSGTVCSGELFTMSPSGALTYSFSNGGATGNPIANTSYTVTGYDANNCAATAVSDVTVFALPVISVNSGSICAGESFTMVPNGTVSFFTYSGNSPVVNPLTNTSYTVTGTDADGCISAPAVSDVTVNALPVVSISGGAICAGNSFTLVPSGALTYTISGGTDIVSPVSNTSYTVSGVDANGCVSLDAVVEVTVNALPVISVNSGSVCAGSVFTMVPSGALNYVYSSGDATVSPSANTSYSVTGTDANGCVSSNTAVSNVVVLALPVISVSNGTICVGNTYVITAAGADTYVFSGGSATVTPATTTSYTVTGTDLAGCTSASQISTVTVNALPVLSITGNTAICSGDNAVLSVSGALSYLWSTMSSNTSVTVSPVSTTTYSVGGLDANGCSNITTHTVMVNALPLITVNSGTVCPGSSFTMVPAGALTFTYSNGSNVVTPSSINTYSVYGTDANGCVSNVPAISTVNVYSPITLTVSGATAICAGQSTTLTASGATSYSWGANAGNAITVNPLTNTSYVLTGVVGVCSTTAAVAVTVNALPSVSAGNNATICAGESMVLTANGANTYLWDNGSATTAITVTPTSNTTYTVTGTDANSCSDKAVVAVNVEICTGLSKVQGSILSSIYPNPNTGEFVISLTKETSVLIVNSLGQVVYSNNSGNTTQTVNLNNEANGIYFVQLKSGNETKTVKVIKN